MGPELFLQLRAAAAVTAGADAADYLGVGLGLPLPPGRAASGGGRRRGRGAAAAAGLGGHRGGRLGFAAWSRGSGAWWSSHGRRRRRGLRRFTRGERRRMGQVVLSHETGRREAARRGPGFEAPGFALQPLSFSEFHFFLPSTRIWNIRGFLHFFLFFILFVRKNTPW